MISLPIYSEYNDSVDLDIDIKTRECELDICIEQSYGSANLTVNITPEKAREIIKTLSAFVNSRQLISINHGNVTNLEERDTIVIGGTTHRLFNIVIPEHITKQGIMTQDEFDYYYEFRDSNQFLRVRADDMPIAYDIRKGTIK